VDDNNTIKASAANGTPSPILLIAGPDEAGSIVADVLMEGAAVVVLMEGAVGVVMGADGVSGAGANNTCEIP